MSPCPSGHTSALPFASIEPVGSRRGEPASNAPALCEYADVEVHQLCRAHGVDYLVVQRQQLGQPFAELVHSTTQSQTPIENSLAWRLAHGSELPQGFAELPFYGSFDPRRFSARIYRYSPVP